MTLRAGALLAALALLVPGAEAQQTKKSGGDKPAEQSTGWQMPPLEISKPGSDFRIALKGYLQADFRVFDDWVVGDGETEGLRADEFEWRRLRLGFEGEWKRLSFEFDVDPAFDEGDELKDAWIDLRIARAVRLRGGHMKLPVSPEFLTSAGKTDFVERAALVNALAPSRDWGVMLHGEIGDALEYQAGLFEGDGRARDDRAERTAAARLVLKPTRWMDLGGSFSQGDVEAAPAGPDLDPRPKGFTGRGVTAYEFFPPMFVSGRRLRFGADALLQAGPVSLRGEYLQGREERKGQGPTLEDLPDARGEGWTVAATWLVTGERKTRTIKPRRALPRGPGAIEVAARYEELRFDDVANQGFESAGSRAANIRPAGFKAFVGGLSWRPTNVLRLMGDVSLERYDDRLRAPQIGLEGNYVSFLGRVQVHLP